MLSYKLKEAEFFHSRLGFGLWHLGMFNFEPYQSSNTPIFEKSSLLELVNFEYTIFSHRAPRPPKMGALRRLTWFQMKHPQVPKVKTNTWKKCLVP